MQPGGGRRGLVQPGLQRVDERQDEEVGDGEQQAGGGDEREHR